MVYAAEQRLLYCNSTVQSVNDSNVYRMYFSGV